MQKSITAKFHSPEHIPDPYRFQSEAIQRIVQSLTEEILALEKSLHGVLIPNSDIQHLFFVPGIGQITAFTVYLEIDGIERFDSDKHFLSYCRKGLPISRQKSQSAAGGPRLPNPDA